MKQWRMTIINFAIKNAALIGLFTCNLRLEPDLDRLNTLSVLLDELIAECEMLTGYGSFVTVEVQNFEGASSK